MPFGPTHNLIRFISDWALSSYFGTIVSVNEDQVPRSGPTIVASNHWNMIIDPALLSTRITFRRKLHYWSKNTLFSNPIARFILIDSGNIPVDRTTKNNQLLFKGTFDVLKLGECIALFPEGTSYTQPKIIQIKDGIGWTALEYAKNLRLTGSKLSGEITSAGQREASEPVRDVKIVICGINYTDKTAYRSSVQLEYAQTIELDQDSISEFLTPGEEKIVVKRLIKQIEIGLRSVTVNADDWETLWCARIIREIIWDDGIGPLNRYRDFTQRLVDVLSLRENPRILKLKTNLIKYHSQLSTLNTSHRIFSSVYPDRDSIGTRNFIEGLRLFLYWPFFLIPFLLHLPIYAAGYLGSLIQAQEIESSAQNKIVVSILIGLITLSTYTKLLSSYIQKISTDTINHNRGRNLPMSNLFESVFSLSISLIILILIHQLHNQLIDKSFESFNRLKLLLKLDYYRKNREPFRRKSGGADDDKDDEDKGLSIDERLWKYREACEDGWKELIVNLNIRPKSHNDRDKKEDEDEDDDDDDDTVDVKEEQSEDSTGRKIEDYEFIKQKIQVIINY
ncbi:hypothetical protein PPACK8108_LOCUS6049 [Phakopsora pachyrhizi]|uniref:Phospholipid/glycerol acyltransferase domain-containing protein n=1 Tax=Phakopsora pachyrhizi TaxID=170000 RepID=A0AAV0ARF6_PHAPC|nr:hypothetical protein PPACK8108_LOCUS6049 [Phakopsora pachyrhizi]